MTSVLENIYAYVNLVGEAKIAPKISTNATPIRAQVKILAQRVPNREQTAALQKESIRAVVQPNGLAKTAPNLRCALATMAKL